jgi:hypothetical protein
MAPYLRQPDAPTMSETSSRPISERQNDPEKLDLMKASSRANLTTQRWIRVRLAAGFLFAGAGFAVTALQDVLPGRWSDVVVTLAVLWTLCHLTLLRNRITSSAHEAALVQEHFDTDLFQTDWNDLAAGDPLRYERLSELTRKFNNLPARIRNPKEFRHKDWYVDTDGLPWPYDALLCQRQNLSWDARLRRRWAGLIYTVLFVWIAVGLVTAVVVDASVVGSILLFLAPSVPVIHTALTSAAGHRSAAGDRNRASSKVHIALTERGATQADPSEQQRLHVLMRQVQDRVLATRLHAPRTPGVLYKYLRKGDEEDHEEGAERIRQQSFPAPGSPEPGHTPHRSSESAR